MYIKIKIFQDMYLCTNFCCLDLVCHTLVMFLTYSTAIKYVETLKYIWQKFDNSIKMIRD